MLDERLRRHLPRLVAGDAVLVVVLALVAWHARHADRADAAVARAIYAPPGSAWRAVADVVTRLGDPMVVAAASIAVAAWAWHRYRDVAVAAFCPVTVVGASVLEHLLKLLVERSRPATAVLAHELDYSYPSGHVTGATALALSAILLVLAMRSRRRGLTIAVAAGYPVAIAVSRLALGVHYLSDVVGAAALASACVLVVATLLSVVDQG